MSAFVARDETELYDLRAFGAGEAQRRRDEREAAAKAEPKATRPRRARKAASGRTVTASELEPGMVPSVPGGVSIASVCADLEAPHLVRYWLEGDDDFAYVLEPEAAVELER